MKIALVEDRVKRQKDFLKKNAINLNLFNSLIDNYTEEKANNLLEDIITDNFDLLKYKIIICHKSIEYNDKNDLIISSLKKYCKLHKKTLVLFSGGISVNYYDNSEFEYLELNSNTLYSQNLQYFLNALKEEKENVLMLSYGKDWELNIVSYILQETNNFISKQTETDVEIAPLYEKIDISKLSKINYEFYKMDIENGWVYLDEIKKFYASLIKFFSNAFEVSKDNYSNILIHNNNIVDLTLFQNRIRFTTNEDIDKYISTYIINELKEKEFDKIFIKDNLSPNYLELYGLRVAYHIRLSEELGDKKFVPIIIISDFNSEILNKFSLEANILFTNGIYLCPNNTEEIKKYQSLELDGLKNSSYTDFLDQINIEKPKDISGNHDIANKWSIYRWANALDVNTEATRLNRLDIENTLYFKHLKALNNTSNSFSHEIIKPIKKGKVLLIDDEWNKGWSDIINKAIIKDGLQFMPFVTNYKDRDSFNDLTYKKISKENPDVVILDLRLLENDHETDDIDNYTGIKILEKIHEINAGIQVIMLTATSKSTILEKLYEKKILGYIKKEHPDDKNIDTVENINKFVKLIDEGLKRKYLKEIWNICIEIRNILDIDFTLSKDYIDCEIFQKFNIGRNEYIQFAIKLHNEAQYVFEILDSNVKNRFIYAMLSIVSSFEAINSIFIRENRYEDDLFWDKSRVKSKKLNDKLEELYGKLGGANNLNIENMIRQRNNYLHSNIQNVHIEPSNLLELFKANLKMIQAIKKSKN